MTTLTAQRHTTAAAEGHGAVDTLLGALRRRYAIWQTERALRGLTDRELDDLGLMRHEIADVARRTATNPGR